MAVCNQAPDHSDELDDIISKMSFDIEKSAKVRIYCVISLLTLSLAHVQLWVSSPHATGALLVRKCKENLRTKVWWYKHSITKSVIFACRIIVTGPSVQSFKNSRYDVADLGFMPIPHNNQVGHRSNSPVPPVLRAQRAPSPLMSPAYSSQSIESNFAP